jgi:TrmH family RNA methyltransferase
MLNFGLSDLRLVNPRVEWPNEKANVMAVGAVDILKNARVFERTEDALADLGFVVVTTGRDRLMSKRVLTPEEAVAELAVEVRETRPCGILFGAERTGVTNEEVILCDAIMTIPTNPQFMSLNLAQSVAVVAYEWWKQTEIKPDFKIPAKFRRTHLANKEDLVGFFEHLEGELDRVQVEITCCGRVTAETAVDDGLIAGAGEVVAVTGVDVSAEFHTLLGGLNEVVLNHLLRVLGGSFRTAVREGQRGHGRKNAEDRCDLFDHVFVSPLLCLFVFP